MLLTEADMEVLEKAGYSRTGFVRYDKQGFAILRNRRGYCRFYDVHKHRCRVYKLRPSGCRIYPVIFDEEEGVVVDSLCPQRKSVVKAEVESEGRVLRRLLETLEGEAEGRAGEV